MEPPPPLPSAGRSLAGSIATEVIAAIDQHLQADAEANAQHTDALRRLVLLRAKADAVQAITAAIMIMALGSTGFALLVLAFYKLATL